VFEKKGRGVSLKGRRRPRIKSQENEEGRKLVAVQKSFLVKKKGGGG
jgi:hypothetical protein